MSNKLIIAAAGSGKTRTLVKRALEVKNENVLITTYTEANEAGIKRKIIKETGGFIPQNITVQTWFGFLLQQGVRPFQAALNEGLWDKAIGFYLVNGASAPYTSETKNFLKHYFTKDLKIYSDKISKFIIKTNKKTEGDLIHRISRIYPHIFIDEVQDLAGYDLEILKYLFQAKSNILLVGDPRQGTYSTNNSNKNKKFKKEKIIHFFEDPDVKNALEVDNASLTTNYRSNSEICMFSNKLFPNNSETSSGQTERNDHEGIFLIRTEEKDQYLDNYSKCTQLRWNARTTVNAKYPFMNFGESKGLDFDRVLIYPTGPILQWLKDNSEPLASEARCKFYVALTRARYSVGIICDDKDIGEIHGIPIWANLFSVH
jgi:DNA helicase-2/ATP-dependent DNA helicase PcrA